MHYTSIKHDSIKLINFSYQEEFIFMGLTASDKVNGPTTKRYKLAESSLLIAAACFALALFVELMFLILGFSILYKRTNAWQVVIHGIGVLCCIWMILDSWRYQLLWAVFVFCGLLPSLLEIIVTFDAVAQSRRENNY